VNASNTIQINDTVDEDPTKSGIIRSLEFRFQRTNDAEVIGAKDVYSVVRHIHRSAQRAQCTDILSMFIMPTHGVVVVAVSSDSENSIGVVERLNKLIADVDRYCAAPSSPVFGLNVIWHRVKPKRASRSKPGKRDRLH
jgi:hypothetical protein